MGPFSLSAIDIAINIIPTDVRPKLSWDEPEKKKRLKNRVIMKSKLRPDEPRKKKRTLTNRTIMGSKFRPDKPRKEKKS